MCDAEVHDVGEVNFSKHRHNDATMICSSFAAAPRRSISFEDGGSSSSSSAAPVLNHAIVAAATTAMVGDQHSHVASLLHGHTTGGVYRPLTVLATVNSGTRSLSPTATSLLSDATRWPPALPADFPVEWHSRFREMFAAGIHTLFNYDAEMMTPKCESTVCGIYYNVQCR